MARPPKLRWVESENCWRTDAGGKPMRWRFARTEVDKARRAYNEHLDELARSGHHVPESATVMVPLDLELPDSAVLKLRVHGLAVGRSVSEVVADLVEAHLTRYQIVDRGE